MLYLKGRPVHMHPGAVVVAEPLQVLLCVCAQDRALQFSVYRGIAEEEGKKKGTNSDNESARRDLGVLPTWQTGPTMYFQIWAERDPTLGHGKTGVSPRVSLLTPKPSTAEVFGPNNPNNPSRGYHRLCC